MVHKISIDCQLLVIQIDKKESNVTMYHKTILVREDFAKKFGRFKHQ